MQLLDLLKLFDDSSLVRVVIYSYVKRENEVCDLPIYEGYLDEIPWSIAIMPLYKNDTNNRETCAISYRDNLGEDFNYKPGLVILVEED